MPSADDVLLRLEGVTKHFPVRSGVFGRHRGDMVRAVDNVSLDLYRGETLGIVGETGCGKSTLARCITRLHTLTSGRIIYDGTDISTLGSRAMRPHRREMQMVFQDPFGSLNPRRRVGSIIGDPFAIHNIARGRDRTRRVQDLMELAGLNPEHYNRFPADFSGGQRQRIGVARALALQPRLIVCDEPVSALDVSIQAQIINLLLDLQTRFGLTYVMIAHGLAVVRHVSHRVAVMYLGEIVELASSQALFDAPEHPYTAALLSATMDPDPDAEAGRQPVVLSGELPSSVNPPSGCRFHPRCPRVQARCRTEIPALSPKTNDITAHLTACHFPLKPGEKLISPTTS